MMAVSEKIFSVFEKPEASDPADRMVLLKEGFSFWALILGGLWLLFNRRWIAFGLYVLVAIIAAVLCDVLHLSEVTSVLVQVFLQVLLAFHAGDLQGLILERRGYRFAGILTAESEMHAQRRYYEHAA